MTRYPPLWEQQGSYAASVDRRLIGAVWPGAASSGCAVSVSSGMTVNVAAGSVSVPTANNTGSVLCTSDAVEPVTLAAAPGSGTNRYDVVICQARGNDLDGGANNDFLFTTVTGTAAATPTVPATPANAVALANVYVPGGSASVTAGNITDVRPGWLALVKAEPFQSTVQLGAGAYGATEVWFGDVLVPNLPYPHRIRYAASQQGSIAASGNVDFRTRYNTTGAAAAFTDTIHRRQIFTVPTGLFSFSLVGALDRPNGGTTRVGVFGLTSGPTFTPGAADPTIGQIELRVVPI